MDNKVETKDLEHVKDMVNDLPTREESDDLFEKVQTDLMEFAAANDNFNAGFE